VAVYVKAVVLVLSFIDGNTTTVAYTATKDTPPVFILLF
jgi:hypothetical protein